MRKREGIMSTTHVDLDGERMAIEGLESLATGINQNYLPLTLEHDIRNAPIGRVASATIVPLDDGEFALKGTFEVFEPGDTILSLQGDGRKMHIEHEDIATFNVGFDRSYETTEGHKFLKTLADLSPESRRIVQVKKGFGAISTLTIIAGTFVGLTVATGFFNKLGEDLYDGLKNALKAHFRSNREPRECLLDFRLTTIVAEPIEIHLLLTNPTPETIEALFSSGFGDLDSYVSRCATLDSVARFVFEYKEGQLESLYVLRRDCVPLRLRSRR